jgi:glucose/arabinose dehydrogenase
VLFVPQPFPNHNAGQLAFGPDGFLYVSLGDGGSGGDPLANGQNLGTRLGKMLRIDVDGGTPYGIPNDNPFLATAGAAPEIWAYGLRNPFRFSFDAATGDLVIGDVGQNRVEEIDLGLASRHGGENYGWNRTEGSTCFQTPAGCATAGLSLPIAEYGHGAGCCVIGGYVYRGRRMPGYHGTYFFTDHCTSFMHSFRIENAQAVDNRDWPELAAVVKEPTSFGVDAAGEIYLVNRGGSVYRIVPAS